MISYAVSFLRHYLTLPVLLAGSVAGSLCWLVLRGREKQGRITRKNRAAFTVLSVYLTLFFAMLVVVRRPKTGRLFSLQLFWSYRAAANGHQDLLNQNLFNILLFVPFGFLCAMTERKPNIWKTIGLGAVLSLLTELTQMLSKRGLFELDDLFHNILGSALGAILWLLISRRRGKSADDLQQRTPSSLDEGKQYAKQAGTEIMQDIELKLFLELLRAGILGQKPDPEQIAALPESWDVEKLVNLALRHDVLLPVYAALAGAEDPGLRQLKKELRALYAPRFAKSVNQECEGEALLNAFEQAGMDCIPLKGWVLRQYYADPLSRSMSDMDILVRHYEHRSIMRVMRNLGYEGDGRSAWKHENFRKKPYMKVELHRRLTDDSGVIREWEKLMWSRCRPEEGRQHVFRMSDEDFYIHHMLHMEEDFRHGTLGFRRIADTWLLLRSCPEMDRCYLENELQSMGILSFVHRAEQLAKVCFEGKEPDAESETLLRYAEQNSISGSEHSYQLGRMAMRSGGKLRKARLRSAWEAVFLPYDRMKAQFPVVEKHPVLLPWCWLRRLLRFAKTPAHSLKKLNSTGISQQELDELRIVLQAGGVLPKEEEEGGRDG